jgi:two-component system nitrogen regulation sensor histidine kinase NtrY
MSKIKTLFNRAYYLFSSPIFRRQISLFLAFIGLILAIITFTKITQIQSFELGSRNLIIILALDVIVFLLLSILIARKVTSLWVSRKQSISGSLLHVKFTVFFSSIVAIPTIIMTILTVLFVHYGLQDWFSHRVKTALNEAVSVANSYLEEHQTLVGRDAILMGQDLRDNLPKIIKDREEFDKFLTLVANLRSLSEAIVFDENHNVIAKTQLTFALEFEPVPASAVDQAKRGEAAILTSEYHNRVRALVKITSNPNLYLFVGRPVDPDVLQHQKKSQDVASEYMTLEGKRLGFEAIVIILFALVAFILLLGSIWVGLTLSDQISRPIISLIEAAEKIRKGKLDVLVKEDNRKDELGLLTRTFNRMVSDLRNNQQALIDVNQKLDDRRHFIESTMAGVSAGVLGFDKNRKINFSNTKAKELLHCELEKEFQDTIHKIIPSLEKMFDIAERKPKKIIEDEVSISYPKFPTSTFSIHVIADRQKDGDLSYVVTLDDITDLISAQKQAAWSDVARRVAHEVKNPLTPIQLAAEKLKRKYGPQIKDSPEIFHECIESISKQVEHLKSLISEFSSFARLPNPIFKKYNLVEITEQAIALQKTVYSQIEFDIQASSNLIIINCDDKLLFQAFTNLIKNSIESIQQNINKEKIKKGKISLKLSTEKENAVIELIDNGVGFNFSSDKNFFDPYITTKTSGTGLGLSIVKKIIEDHKGQINLYNNKNRGGAQIKIYFPLSK